MERERPQVSNKLCQLAAKAKSLGVGRVIVVIAAQDYIMQVCRSLRGIITASPELASRQSLGPHPPWRSASANACPCMTL